jgi:hypothetical protein
MSQSATISSPLFRDRYADLAARIAPIAAALYRELEAVEALDREVSAAYPNCADIPDTLGAYVIEGVLGDFGLLGLS